MTRICVSILGAIARDAAVKASSKLAADLGNQGRKQVTQNSGAVLAITVATRAAVETGCKNRQIANNLNSAIGAFSANLQNKSK